MSDAIKIDRSDAETEVAEIGKLLNECASYGCSIMDSAIEHRDIPMLAFGFGITSATTAFGMFMQNNIAEAIDAMSILIEDEGRMRSMIASISSEREE